MTDRNQYSGFPPEQNNPQAQPPYRGTPQAQPPYQGAPQAQPPYQGAPQAQPPYQGAPQAQPPYPSAPQAQPPYQGAPQAQAAYPGRSPYPESSSRQSPYDSLPTGNPPVQEPPAPKKRKTGLIAGLILGISAVIGIGIGAFLLLRKPAPEPSPNVPVTETERRKEKQKEPKKAPGKTPGNPKADTKPPQERKSVPKSSVDTAGKKSYIRLDEAPSDTIPQAAGPEKKNPQPEKSPEDINVPKAEEIRDFPDFAADRKTALESPEGQGFFNLLKEQAVSPERVSRFDQIKLGASYADIEAVYGKPEEDDSEPGGDGTPVRRLFYPSGEGPAGTAANTVFFLRNDVVSEKYMNLTVNKLSRPFPDGLSEKYTGKAFTELKKSYPDFVTQCQYDGGNDTVYFALDETLNGLFVTTDRQGIIQRVEPIDVVATTIFDSLH